MKNLQICLPHLSDVATLSWEIQKSFFNIILLQIIYVSSQKTNSNCSTTVLSICLLLFSASYYLHSPSTTSGARSRRSEQSCPWVHFV